MAPVTWSFGSLREVAEPAPPLRAELAPGRRFAGRYLIEGALGRGAMGVVMRAIDTSLDRAVAIKVMATAIDERRRARFMREGELTAALRHPAIVGIHGGGVTADGLPFLVLELVEDARELAKVLPELTVAERLELLVGVARGVGHAHARGVCHRDLKPHNVLLDGEGRAKVCDFGLAWCRGLDRLTQEGSLVGTPLYASPEQAQGVEPAPQHDVWSLGVMAYQMATDTLPFTGTTLSELLAQIYAANPPPPSTLADVSPALEAVILRALAADPADRFADANALADALEVALRAGARWTPGWVAAWVGALALAAGATAWALSGGDPPPPHPSPSPSLATSPAEVASPAAVPRSVAALVERARLAVRRERFERALTWANDALAQAPDHVPARVLRATCLLRQDARAGLRELEAALALDPTCADAYFARGEWYGGDLQDVDSAWRDIERALELDPGHLDARVQRAILLLRRGQPEAGAAEVDGILALDPDHIGARSLRGTLRGTRHELEGALVDFSRVVELDPEDPTAYVNRAAARIQTGDFPGALDDLGRAVEINPGNQLIYVNRGNLRRQLGDLDGAEADFLRALELDADNPVVHANLGGVELRRRSWPEAGAHFSRAIALKGDYGAAFGGRASALAHLGDREGARADYRRALELSPRSPSAPGWRKALRALGRD